MSHLWARTNNLYEFPYTSNLGLSGSGNNRTVIEKVYNGSSVIKLQPNTTYYMSGDRSTSQDVNGVIALFTSYPTVGSISKHFYYYNSTSQPGVEFTTESDEVYGLIEHRSSSDYTTDYHMMLNVGTTALPYEPYRIEKPFDHIRLNNVRSENLLDKDNFIDGGDFYPQNGSTPQMTASVNTDILLIPCYPNTTYTVSRTTWITKRFSICFVDTDQIVNGTPITGYTGSNGNRGDLVLTSTSASGSKFMCIYYGKHAGTDSSTSEEISQQLAEIMVNEGPTALPYQPYLITKEAWEARDKNDNLLWGRADTFTGTSSISARCYGLPVKSWEIDGNSQQSGTPSQDDPVYPEFVGERTENLFGVAIEQGSFNNTTGALYDSNQRVRTAEFIEQTGQMTIDTSTGNDVVIYVYSESGTFDSESSIINWQSCPYTFSIASGKKFKIAFRKPGNPIISTADVTGIMLNFGSTALPYEPYGYSIQTSSSTQNTVSGQTPLTLTDSVGHNLISWDGEGATTSSGTPAPTSPVTVSGWGDKTANLFDEIYPSISTSVQYIPLYVGNGSYTLSSNIPNAGSALSPAANIFLLSGNVSSGASSTTNGVWIGNPITQSAIDGYITIAYRNNYEMNPEDYNTMLNTGSTALPYEPYGYKLSLISTGHTTPVYLGQVPTTRRVRKLVLTGEDDWFVASSNSHGITNFQYPSTISDRLAAVGNILSTHYVSSTAGNADVTEPSIRIINSGTMYIRMYTSSYSTADAFKTYLQQQYAAGTPVTIWYVLAEPTTGIVNEPLMKIGDYADSITSTQAGVTIPTAKGNATLTTSNTVQPSTIHATYDKYISGGDIPVYLGQVPTTRRIKKMVFDGTENWFATGGGDTLVYNTSINASGVPDSTAGSICTHLEYGDRYTQGQYDIGESGAIRISAKGFASLSAFTQFLVDEYANGMPVTVWYVLATPTTGVVNEPLCKIGTYVDTLTSDQAGITIPTTDGSTTISVDTSLAPSKFEIKVHAKPI